MFDDVVARLTSVDVDTVSTVELVEGLSALESVKAAAAATQARLAEALDARTRADRAARGLPQPERGKGVAAQVALARRESPWRGGQHLGLATALVREMPHTLAALEAGRLSEWRATILVRETAFLTREQRGIVDAELCADPRTLEGLGDRAVTAAAARIAYRVDPRAATARAATAAKDRGVSLRPAPDVMSQLSARLPVADGVATYAALRQEADRARASGDPRSRNQVMADTLVERVTGRSVAEGVDIEVGLVMTDRSLLDGDAEPAVVAGFGPVPAPWARDLVARRFPAHDSADEPDETEGADQADEVAELAKVMLRRLWTDPDRHELVSLESSAADFPLGLRRFLVHRDQICRTPWCDAPVRHADHSRSRRRGGETNADNGQGLCEACNYAKESADWSAGPAPGSRPGRHRVLTTTPTGHTYESRPPPLPGATTIPLRVVMRAPDCVRPSRFELHLADAWGHAA